MLDTLVTLEVQKDLGLPKQILSRMNDLCSSSPRNVPYFLKCIPKCGKLLYEGTQYFNLLP